MEVVVPALAASRIGLFRLGTAPLAVVSLCVVAWLVSSVRADEQPAAEKPPEFTAEQTAAGIELFQKHVRVALAHKCVHCHGRDSTEGEFNLTTREGLLRGGSSGPAVTLGNGKASHLYKLAARLEEPYMPDEGENLTADELAHLERWIDLGAPYDKPLLEPDADKSPWTERTVAPDA
ncbi:MAG: hypothetical protein DCC68_02880, partial [Planctomycetota bacterium]